VPKPYERAKRPVTVLRFLGGITVSEILAQPSRIPGIATPERAQPRMNGIVEAEFVEMTEAIPSVARAVIMGTLGVWSK